MQQPQYTCPRCGAPIQAGQAACTNCGLALDPQSIANWQASQMPQPPGYETSPLQPPGYGTPPPQPPQPVYVAPAPPPMGPASRPPGRQPRWLIPVLAGVLLLCGVCGVIAVIAQGNQNQADRQAAAQATLTAVARQLATPPTVPPMAGLPTEPAGPTATLRPDEANVEAINRTNYTDDQDNLVLIGQLQNTGHGIADEIEVTGEVLDATGVRVASGKDLLLALVGLPPGVKAPYMIRLGKPTGEADKVHVSWSYKTYDSTGIHVFVPAQGLSVEGQQFEQGLGSTPGQVTGQVKNGGSKEAMLVQVLVSGYDAAGELVAVESGRADPATIPAGGTASFTIQFTSRPDAEVTKVDVLPVGNEGQ